MPPPVAVPVTRNGTVHVALNEADRWTGCCTAGGLAAGVVLAMVVVVVVLGQLALLPAGLGERSSGLMAMLLLVLLVCLPEGGSSFGGDGVMSNADAPNVIGVDEGRRRTGGVGGVVVRWRPFVGVWMARALRDVLAVALLAAVEEEEEDEMEDEVVVVLMVEGIVVVGLQ